jgi:putative toxin-antitoxin system antitoxin component (TIGR02293 family)
MKTPEIVDYKNLLTAISLKQLRGYVVGIGTGDFDKEREEAKRAVAERVVGENAQSKEDERNPRIDEILRRVEEIFKDPDKATLWLNSPNYTLGGQVPLQLIESEEGLTLVFDELGRIEHGIPI